MGAVNSDDVQAEQGNEEYNTRDDDDDSGIAPRAPKHRRWWQRNVNRIRRVSIGMAGFWKDKPTDDGNGDRAAKNRASKNQFVW